MLKKIFIFLCVVCVLCGGSMKIEAKSLPMKEAIEYWKSKVPLSPGQYKALSDEAKTKAFAVAGIAKQSELETVFNALQRSLDEGTTFADFKKDAGDVFDKRGWTKEAPWRIKTIYRTNVQSAYSVGRYKQMKGVAVYRPYWMYVTVGDNRVRQSHRPHNGKVYRHNHEFWNIWYPPNGYNDRCGVQTLSERQVKARGIKIETTVPKGIEPPGKGFAVNMGAAQWGGVTPGESVAGKLVDIGTKGYTTYKRKKLNNLPKGAYTPFSEKDLLKPAKDLKMGREKAEEFYLSAFMREFGLKSTESAVFKDAIGDPLLIDKLLFMSGGAIKITKAGREKYLKLLAGTIKKPYEIWLVPQKNDAGKIILRRRYIRAFSAGPDEKLSGFVAFDYGKFWTGVTAFAPDKLAYGDRLRNGVLLYKEG